MFQYNKQHVIGLEDVKLESVNDEGGKLTTTVLLIL